MSTYLVHHEILKQKWGVRNGPPYPLRGGDYSVSEKKAIYKERRKENSIYNKKPTEEDLKVVYRMFNYVIPSDGSGNARIANDVAKQRAKFFKELKNEGYAAVLDTNDAIYGGFKATAPVIIFDQDQVLFEGADMTSMNSRRVSKAITAGRKVIGV